MQKGTENTGLTTERIFTGLLYPEIITFKDCRAPLERDVLIGLPQCRVLKIISTEKQKVRPLPRFK